MSYPFAKYVGCGNDFILFDNRAQNIPLKSPTQIQRLCDRKLGIGADGVILLENAPEAHARMRIFNSDGSEAEMCGNGLRCLAKWMRKLGIPDPCLRIQTMNSLLKAWPEVSGEPHNVRVDMPQPRIIDWAKVVEAPFGKEIVYVIDTGVPHAVILTDDSELFSLDTWGPFLRWHECWQPKGTNVTIGQRLGNRYLRVRTFERGVEGETLACGTGAAALAVVTAMLDGLSGPIRVQTRLGDILQFDYSDREFKNLTMTGPAHPSFEGVVALSSDKEL